MFHKSGSRGDLSTAQQLPAPLRLFGYDGPVAIMIRRWVLVVLATSGAVCLASRLHVDAAPAPRAPQAATVRPGAPGQPTHVVPPGAPPTSPASFTPADVAFMQNMIHHHAQAVEMVALLKTRTTREDMRLLGRRISVSQQDEITLMGTWLSDRGRQVPTSHGPGMMMVNGEMLAAMPGMLSAADMAALAHARGSAFDRLFLTDMIRHHEGALAMVDDLLTSPGAGQESVIFDFITQVNTDQRAEIARMRRMLEDSQ